MFNQVILVGRLVRDPEARKTPSGKSVVSASLATSKKFKTESGEIKEQTEFHNLVIWNGADAFAMYTAKGSKLHVVGELRTRMWEKEGQKHYSTEIIVSQFIFLDEKKREKDTAPAEDNGTADFNDNDAGGEDEIRVENIPF
jgi:single-strand DNA-binding protein